jgi:hypothetical protein
MTFLLLYTDPGSGTMLLQLLLATIAGGAFYFRSFFYRLFGKNIEQTELADENGDEERK